MDYSIQLFSVRDFMAKDVEGTIKQLAEMGYKCVEPCGFYDKTAEEFKAICDKYSMKISGCHLYHDALKNDNDMLEYMKAIGCPAYISPCAIYSNRAEVEELVDLYNTLPKKVNDFGLQFQYHNHDLEFLPNKDGIYTHIELQKRTNILFQLDVYWIYRAGINPMYVLEQLEERIGSIHLRDGDMKHTTPLGQGEVDIAGIVKWAKERNIPMTVETETSAARQMDEAKECIEYLLSLEN